MHLLYEQKENLSLAYDQLLFMSSTVIHAQISEVIF